MLYIGNAVIEEASTTNIIDTKAAILTYILSCIY